MPEEFEFFRKQGALWRGTHKHSARSRAAAPDTGPPPLQLTGGNCEPPGRQVRNDKLEAALKRGNLSFTRAELREFDLSTPLSANSFVRVEEEGVEEGGGGARFFAPAGR